MARRVPFIAAELGADVEPFMLHIYASLAQKERSLISHGARFRHDRRDPAAKPIAPAISRHPNLIVVLDKGGTGCDERLLNCVNG